jgi:hypothetical protein
MDIIPCTAACAVPLPSSVSLAASTPDPGPQQPFSCPHPFPPLSPPASKKGAFAVDLRALHFIVQRLRALDLLIQSSKESTKCRKVRFISVLSIPFTRR